MRCPRCQQAMLIVEHRQIELDHCVACQGLWFDGEELELVFASLDAREAAASLRELMALARRPVKEKTLRCPRCRRRMEKVVVASEPEQLLDRCPAGDGLWFDGGELHAVLEHLQERGGGAIGRAVAFVEKAFPRPAGHENEGEAPGGSPPPGGGP